MQYSHVFYIKYLANMTRLNHLVSRIFAGIVLSLLSFNVLSQATSNFSFTFFPVHAPKEVLKDYSSLALNLTSDVKTSEEKFLLIHNWVLTNYQISDKISFINPLFENTPGLLKKKKITPQEMIFVFKELCREAQVPIFVIEGYSKGKYYKPGQVFSLPDKFWVAFQSEEKWLLFDIVNTKLLYEKQEIPLIYSLPENLILTHFPTTDYWQLIKCPVTIQSFISDPSVIKNELNSMGAIPCMNIKDSISKQNDMLFYGANAYRNNPLNTMSKAYGYIYANHIQLSEKARQDTIINLLKIQKTTISLQYKMALRSMKLVDSTYNSYIKLFIKENNKIILKNQSYIKKNQAEIKSLKLENAEIVKLNKSINNESLDGIKRTKKKNSPDEIALIQSLYKQVLENKNQFDLNKKYIADLKRSNDEERELFINQNINNIIGKNELNLNLFDSIIQCRKDFPFETDQMLFENLNEIKINKSEEERLRKLNKEEGFTYILSNARIIDSIYKINRNLIKENKKILNKMIKLSASDNQELVLYAEENKAFYDNNELMRSTNLKKMEDAKMDNVYFKLEIDILAREQKMIKKLNAIQQSIVKRFNAYQLQWYEEARAYCEKKISNVKIGRAQ